MKVKRQHFKLLVEVDVYDSDCSMSEEVLEHYVRDLLDKGEIIKTRRVESYEKKTNESIVLDNVGDGRL